MRDVVLQGDCLEVLASLPAASVNAVVTSPPYAQQRARFYGGVSEAQYPAWSVAWMQQVRRVLVPDGSVLINIREHVRAGQISDYVHHTRLALRADGWCECDELIWVKPGSPPVGHPGRPRRSWERILWFASHQRPWCDPRANGEPSRAIGMAAHNVGRNVRSWLAGTSEGFHDGTARSPDYFAYSVGANNQPCAHPAAFPPALATWMLRLVCPVGGLVLDPFAGSGTTAVACLEQGRHYVLIEQDPRYVALAHERIAAGDGPGTGRGSLDEATGDRGPTNRSGGE